MKKFILKTWTGIEASSKTISISNGVATVWAKDARTAAQKVRRFLSEIGQSSCEYGVPKKRSVIKTCMRRAARNAAKRSEVNPTADFKEALKLAKGGGGSYICRYATFLSFGKKGMRFD